ncbi:DNA-binding transcriptional regulator, XRE family [Sarcina sp. DSM 11001]|uniref:helix-turn-helix domain-containing protein n=1 Tax=Sarcina sp. DSM 11001 TaxID=1798184 RepID=UPI0008814773|nr:helix-turn-helix transcriptional regulator [Sarcina sp. DSM 11001]SDM02532.1 DNA-binding transcriptional regulator, XRE family [Sarcina sp. DSM 11001]
MTRSYKKLWHILLDRDMSRSQLRKKAGISTNALAKLGKDESLPLETLEKVCAALDCTLDDILEYVPDKETDGGVDE